MMPAPRKPASEKAIARQVTFRPWVDEFLATMSPGTRSPWLNELIESSPDFRRWWEAVSKPQDCL